MKKSKQLGQVPTPLWIVNEILNACQYSGSHILRKYALEPSCGDGAFLSEMVARYIAAAQSEGQHHSQIIKELETYIIGVELDIPAYQSCIQHLNQLVGEKLGVSSVQWRIYQQNTLDFYRDYRAYFDWILGNPPYIRIHHLDELTRNRLKQEFHFTVGTTDMYLAFFEMAFFMLNQSGKLGFITPNSFLHNTSYQKFRQFLQQQGKLTMLYDLKSNKVFDGYSTYTAISIFENNHQQPEFVYKELILNKFEEVNKIAFTHLNAKKWTLTNSQQSEFLHTLHQSHHAKLQDFFDVQYGFATLRDKIFIAKSTCLNNELSEFNGDKIETAILRPIVKGSRYKGQPEDVESVLFPYVLENGRYRAYLETELAQQFPFAYAYLLKNKEELLKRDTDKKAQWFEFGRSQGLQTSHREKIVISPLVNGSVQFFRLPENVLVYSGIFMTKKTPDVDWQIAEQALSSVDFFQYARLTGKDMSGGYKSLSSKAIKAFSVSAQRQDSLF